MLMAALDKQTGGLWRKNNRRHVEPVALDGEFEGC